jgi:uroporphyrinogen-III synthase
VAGETMREVNAAGKLPLAHRRILVTRAPRQASELADRLRDLGATPILIPTIEIAPPTSFAALDAALASLSTFDVLAFTSANAVESFRQRAASLGITPAPRRIAVVGSSTAHAVETLGLEVDIVPAIFTAAATAETLAPEASGQRILLVLAEAAPTTLRDRLIAAGAEITVAAAYSNRIPESSLEAITSLFSDPAGYPHAVTFTSASTASNLVALLDAAGLTLPAQVVRASIGPITSRALRDLGLPPHVEAADSTIAALAASLADHFQSPSR